MRKRSKKHLPSGQRGQMEKMARGKLIALSLSDEFLLSRSVDPWVRKANADNINKGKTDALYHM